MAWRIGMVAACPLPARRGTPLRVERLAEALAARGHAVELITYHLAEPPGELRLPTSRIFGKRTLGTLPPGPTPLKLGLYDPALALLVARRLRQARFDLLHAHHVEGLLAAALGRAGGRLGGRAVPLVYDAHTLLAGELPAYGHGRLRRASRALGRKLDGVVPKLAEAVVAVTEDIATGLVEEHGLDPERVSVVANGVEVELFAGPAAAIAADPDLVVYTGTLAPYQGIDLLLEAFAQARGLRPSLRLRLLSEGNFAPYAARAKALGVAGAIELVPATLERLPWRLAEAGVAVLPRVDCPGLPQKLLNYMAAGRAVVAFSGSAKGVADGVTGLVVADRDVAGFAAAMVRLAGDAALARRLGAQAQAWVRARASWAQAAERCERVYARLLGQQSHPAHQPHPVVQAR